MENIQAFKVKLEAKLKENRICGKLLFFGSATNGLFDAHQSDLDMTFLPDEREDQPESHKQLLSNIAKCIGAEKEEPYWMSSGCLLEFKA